MSSAKEPVPGWISSKTGVSGLLLLYCMGVVHSLPVRSDTTLDLVPIDMTVNCLLASIWDLSTHKKSEGPQVYNYGSSYWKPIFDQMYLVLKVRGVQKYPLNHMYWYPFLILTGHYYLFVILNAVFNIIPAVVYDFGCWTAGKKRQGLQLTLKIAQFSTSLHYLLSHSWVVEVESTQNILVHLNKADYKEFPSDLGKLDKFMCNFSLAMRTYLMKQSKDSVPAVRERFRKLRIVHYTIYTCFLVFAMFFVFKTMSTVFCKLFLYTNLLA